MRFENSHLLWLLLVIPPVLALFFWWASRSRQKLLSQFIHARLLSQLTVGISPARRKMRFTFLILAVAFLIIALARPQYGFDLQEIQQRGLDIVIAVDTSKSMLAADIAPNRLERAKLAALELMQRAGTDRLGLEAFAGDAFLECPLTVDNTAFQQSVQALNVNSIPEGGTDLAGAIDTALSAFKEQDTCKALVLLTDGEDNVDEAAALAAAQKAAKAGLEIFTVGIGTAAGDLIRVTDANGNSDYVRDAQGNVVKSHLNEPLLKQIATATHGFYLHLSGADTMDTLYDRGLAPLPKTEGEAMTIRRYHEQFQWPLAAAILLLLAEIFLPERNSMKYKVQGPKSKAEATTIAALIGILLLPVAAKASPASALQDFKSGNYTNALAEYSKLAEIHTNDLRYVFNAGTAAYRATNYDEALKDFQSVTLSPDLNLQQQAFYNLGNTLYRMGELKFTPDSDGLDAMEESWTNAAQSYAHAVQLNTNDADAVYNLSFVKQQIALIDQLRAMMRQAKLSADDAVRRDEFHRAYEIMAQLTQNKIAAKQFQDFTKKLKQIDEIDTTNQP
ncbi:MAG TPA: VWA domain-containing protein [Candidatus Paceibacterota bacterium]|nr:VWA domain-containing protein [Candidatus Paceibacterota bacterium]